MLAYHSDTKYFAPLLWMFRKALSVFAALGQNELVINLFSLDSFIEMSKGRVQKQKGTR